MKELKFRTPEDVETDKRVQKREAVKRFLEHANQSIDEADPGETTYVVFMEGWKKWLVEDLAAFVGPITEAGWIVKGSYSMLVLWPLKEGWGDAPRRDEEEEGEA